MNPYEKTAQELKRQSEGPKRLAKNVASVGTAVGAASFAPLLSRVAPFLSEYIPEDLAIKGLSKINPRFGNFVKKSLGLGHDFNEVKGFIGDQINQSEQKIPMTEEEKSVSDKTSEIGKLFSLAKKGKTQGNEFLKYASSLIKSQDIADEDTFTNFYKWWNAKPSKKRGSPRSEFELFRSEIGNTLNQSKAALQSEVLNPAPSTPTMEPSAEMQPAQNQQSNGDEAILAAFQKIMQM